MMLESEGLDVIGEAADGAEAISAAARLSPAIVLLDVQLPDTNGFAVARAIGGRGPGGGPAIVMISSRDYSDYGSAVAESGALGFVPKGELSGARVLALVEESP